MREIEVEYVHIHRDGSISFYDFDDESERRLVLLPAYIKVDDGIHIQGLNCKTEYDEKL